MKKLLIGLIVILSIGFAQEHRYAYDPLVWNTGEAMSDTLITTGTDATDWFLIPFGVNENARYPETLSFLLWSDSGAAADSADGTFTLELTNDKVTIFTGHALSALNIGTADPNVVMKVLTDMPLFKYGRVRITAALAAGDSAMFGAQLTRDVSNY